MADEEHVALLKQGEGVWNAWRDENVDITPDLRNANLRGMDLSGTYLSNADLSDANLTGMDLRKAFLRDATLTAANLSDANLIGANLRNANLNDAYLRRTNLSFADLFSANLRRADLSRADLSGAYLSRADFSGAHLNGADLSHAFLRSADLSRAELLKSKLCNADLRTSSLIDTKLDGADLTDAKFWEAQRSGWTIKGIICKRVSWDREGTELTEYEDGAFERLFAEKSRIVLRYAGGMSPVDLAMLPLIVERLQADYPNSSLHIRSVQDDGSGATVTITVEDLTGRSHEVFAQEVEKMRGNFAILQQRLHQEERLRLDAEAGYRAMVQDILPKLLEKALPQTNVLVGHITGPTIIESTTMSNDTYNIHGQASAVGKNAHAHDMTFEQAWNQSNIDLPKLAKELEQLRSAMKEATGKDDQDEAIGTVAAAEKAAIKGDGPTTLQYLKNAGKWTLGIAEKIGVSVAVEVIKRAM
jgi:uncharacterized protein YjbI with pentapeptide repeats